MCFILPDSVTFFFGQRPKTSIPCPFGDKNRYTLSVWGQKQVHTLNQVKNAPHESCDWSRPHCTCFCLFKPQVHLSLSTLLDFQLFFCRFLANQRPSIVPPYAPHTNADVRGDPLHPPQPTPHYAPRHTSNTRIHVCSYLCPRLHRAFCTVRAVLQTATMVAALLVVSSQ